MRPGLAANSAVLNQTCLRYLNVADIFVPSMFRVYLLSQIWDAHSPSHCWLILAGLVLSQCWETCAHCGQTSWILCPPAWKTIWTLNTLESFLTAWQGEVLRNSYSVMIPQVHRVRLGYVGIIQLSLTYWKRILQESKFKFKFHVINVWPLGSKLTL